MQQPDKWKDKYYQAIQDIEQQKVYAETLTHALSRLALTAQGLDTNLDSELSVLRQLIKTQEADVSEIQTVIKKIERAISEIQDPLAANTHREPGKSLSESSSETSQSSLPCPDDCNLVDHDSQCPTISHVLLQLLQKITLPENLSEKATSITESIEKGLTKDNIVEAVNDISTMISELSDLFHAGKQEYEQYLESISSKFIQLEQRIRSGNQESLDAFKSRQAIGQSFKSQVTAISDGVKESQSVEQIKNELESRLDSLRRHFESYQQSDFTQFKNAQEQVKTLKQQLKVMEQETAELRSSVKKNRELARKDPLTQLFNRHALDEILLEQFNRWLRYRHPLTIVIWELDHFKNINDTFGHSAGDKVLKTVAKTLLSHTRTTDFISRYGGEEFVGVFPESAIAEVALLTEKIRNAVIHSRFHYDGTSVDITVSAGIATFREGDTIENVFKRADKALYDAKEKGRNCYVSADSDIIE